MGGVCLENASEQMKNIIVEVLKDKKAKDIKVLSIEELSILTDYFVMATGTSTTHVKSLAENLEQKMKESGYEIHHKEGFRSGRWILLDYYDVVVHLFYEEERGFYNLERLWADAELVSLKED